MFQPLYGQKQGFMRLEGHNNCFVHFLASKHSLGHFSPRLLKKPGDGTRKRDTGEPRAVKLYSKAAAAMPLDAIREEFELLKSLDHPNIARISDPRNPPLSDGIGSVWLYVDMIYGV